MIEHGTWNAHKKEWPKEGCFFLLQTTAGEEKHGYVLVYIWNIVSCGNGDSFFLWAQRGFFVLAASNIVTINGYFKFQFDC